MGFIQAYRVKRTDANAIDRLNALSKRCLGKPNTGIKKFEFLEIKKSPLYCVEGEETNIYLLLDNTFLIEKSYEIFFWDFYFDELQKGVKALKNGEVMSVCPLKNTLKVFLTIVFKVERISFLNRRINCLLKGDEYADYYIRRKRNIVLVQAKRSYIPQGDYKEVYSLKDYNDLDKDKFYDRFGLNQIIDMSINKFDDYAPVIDSKLPSNKLFIYPVLLINEPIISFAVTTFIFNRKFEQMLSHRGIDKESAKWRINRLVVYMLVNWRDYKRHLTK